MCILNRVIQYTIPTHHKTNQLPQQKQQALVSEPATATLSTLLLAAICGIACQCTEEEVRRVMWRGVASVGIYMSMRTLTHVYIHTPPIRPYVHTCTPTCTVPYTTHNHRHHYQVGFVIGVIGAILGTGVVYIIPALLNGKLLDRVKDAKAALPEKRLNRAIVAMGAVFAVLGTYAALEEHFPGLISGLLSGKAPVAKVKLH